MCVKSSCRVLVPLQGATAVCAWELGCWCRSSTARGCCCDMFFGPVRCSVPCGVLQGTHKSFCYRGSILAHIFFNICFMVVRLQTFGCPHRRLVIFDDPSEAPITGMAQWLSHRAALHLGEDMTETR